MTAHDISERDWVVVSTPNFRVHSDLPGGRVKEIAESLEQDLALIGLAAFGSADASVDPTDVIIFAKDHQFRRYFGSSVRGVAYRAPLLPERTHTIVTYRTLDATTRRTLRHELVHDLFARKFGSTPPWLSEGYAEYYSTVELVRGEIHVGRALPDRTLTNAFEPTTRLRGGRVTLAIPHRLIPAASELVRMTASDFYETERSFDTATSIQTHANYFGAWALVHFLMEANQPHSARFREFLSRVRTTSVSEAWRHAFSDVDEATLDRDFRNYLASGSVVAAAISGEGVNFGHTEALRALSTGEKHVLLAKLALASTRPPAEKEALFFEQAEASVLAQPPTPEAYYLRGTFFGAEGNREKAGHNFERALHLSPDDPRFTRAWLEHRLGEVGRGEDRGGGDALRDEVRKLESLATSPHELLFVARYEAEFGDPHRAVSVGKRAASNAPSDPIVLAKYAKVLEACGDFEGAIAVQRLAVDFAYDDLDLWNRYTGELKQLESRARQAKVQTKVLSVSEAE